MTEQDPGFQSRVWFVTGASSGFGRAISNAVLQNGGRLVATSLVS